MRLSRFVLDDLTVNVYDPSIPGPASKKIASYPNFRIAGKYLQICEDKIRRHSESQTRLFIPHLNKELAFRVKKA